MSATLHAGECDDVLRGFHSKMSRVEFYQWYSANLIEYGQLEEWVRSFYSDPRQSNLGARAHSTFLELKRLGEGYEALAVDPGIMVWAEEFSVFVRRVGERLDPWEMRKRFSEELGTATVYLAGPRQTVGQFQSPFVQALGEKLSDPDEALGYLGQHFMRTSLGQTINLTTGLKIESNQEESFLVQVTSHPQLAAIEAANAWIYELEIPVLDLIPIQKPGLLLPPQEFPLREEQAYVFTPSAGSIHQDDTFDARVRQRIPVDEDTRYWIIGMTNLGEVKGVEEPVDLYGYHVSLLTPRALLDYQPQPQLQPLPQSEPRNTGIAVE